MPSNGFTMAELFDCPACGSEMEVLVRTIDEPATKNYPGHFEQYIERPAICVCGYVFAESDLPEPVDESDGFGS